MTKLRVKILPGAHILGFLLNPGDALSVFVQCQGILKLRLWKWVELFKPDDGDIFEVEARALLLELIIDLTAAQKNFIYSLTRVYQRIWNDAPESHYCTLLQSRDRFRMT